jgi:hypothetical protein
VASGGFALLGEVLLTGVIIALLALPVVTLPAALAAGIRHLRRFVNDEGSRFSAVWRDARDAAAGGIAVAITALFGTAAALFAIGLAAADPTAVGTAMAIVGRLGLGVVATAVVMAAATWTPDGGWLRAVRSLRDRLDADPVAALYLFVAVVLAAVLTWQFLLLLIPSLGVVAFAAVAVESRSRARVSGTSGTERST